MSRNNFGSSGYSNPNGYSEPYGFSEARPDGPYRRDSFPSSQSILQQGGLRNQFISNSNSSNDNLRYDRVQSTFDDEDDDFNFTTFPSKNASDSTNDFEMNTLAVHEDPQNPFEPPPFPPPKHYSSQQFPYPNDNEHLRNAIDNHPYLPPPPPPPPANENPFETSPYSYIPTKPQPPVPGAMDEEQKLRVNDKERIRQLRRVPRFHYTRLPYFGILVTIIQIIVFIVELIKMAELTGSAFQTKPYFNPMLGPSTYVQINMGARYVPCMNGMKDLTNDTSIQYPCPNSTTLDTNVCSLSELCGLSGIPVNEDGYNPGQWYRIITPIFLHAGFLHIIFNLLLQATMGFTIERIIGLVKYGIIYMASGISGFLLGANFSAGGIASSGASGALFGVVATNIVMFIYCGKKNTNMYGTKRFGLFLTVMIAEIIVSFVLGLLPGLDNFSHIGGFAMGLLLSIVFLQDPFFVYHDGIITYHSHVSTLQQFVNNWNPLYNFDDKIASRFYIWCGVRIVSLILVVLYFALLAKNFFGPKEVTESNNCSWCKYISCIPVNGWCDIGTVSVESQPQTNDSGSGSGSGSEAGSSSDSSSGSSSGSDSNSGAGITPQDIQGDSGDSGPSKRQVLELDMFETFSTPPRTGPSHIGPSQYEHQENISIILLIVMTLLTLKFFKTKK